MTRRVVPASRDDNGEALVNVADAMRNWALRNILEMSDNDKFDCYEGGQQYKVNKGETA